MPAAATSHASAPAPKRRPRRARAVPVSDTQLSAEQKRLIRLSFLRIEPALDLVAQLFFLKLFRHQSVVSRLCCITLEVMHPLCHK